MATRAKYQRVKPQEDTHQTKLDTDILMRMSQSYGKYVSRALTLFFGEEKQFVTLKAAERLIDRAIWVAEVVKRKVPGLHQVIKIDEKKIVDVFKPKEEGLLEVHKERFLTLIEITLTKTPTAEQRKQPGYQPPLTKGNYEFLTKEKWEQAQKEKQQRREEREGKRDFSDQKHRSNNRDERGRERQRGGRRN